MSRKLKRTPKLIEDIFVHLHQHKIPEAFVRKTSEELFSTYNNFTDEELVHSLEAEIQHLTVALYDIAVIPVKMALIREIIKTRAELKGQDVTVALTLPGKKTQQERKLITKRKRK